MTIIETLLEQVYEEIDGATQYAELALKYKDDNKSLADMYNDLSKQEYNHIQIIYAELKKCINSIESECETLNELLDWQSSKIIDGCSKAKILIDLYR
nr:MAG TPA: ferritin [Caudoviricetes sp.]